MAALALIGTLASSVAPALMAGGTILGTVGAMQQGKAAQAAADHTALQLEAQGKTERAVAQREGLEQRKQANLISSRARAVGAASGGGLDLEAMGDIEEEGEYRTLTAIWEGEERAKGRQAQASAARVSGQNARKAGNIRAFGTTLSGGASLLDKYG